MAELLGIRGYARYLGVTPNAVLRAVQSDRIPYTRDEKNRPKIDPAVADPAWAANTSHGHRRRENGIDGQGVAPGASDVPVKRGRGRPRKNPLPAPPPPAIVPPAPVEDPGGEDDDDGDDGSGGPNFTQSNAREKFWKAKMAELKFREAEGELIPIETVKREWMSILSAVRSKMLAVPSKVKLRVPALTADDVMTLQDLIGEALADLAAQETEPSGSD